MWVLLFVIKNILCIILYYIYYTNYIQSPEPNSYILLPLLLLQDGADAQCHDPTGHCHTAAAQCRADRAC